MLLVNQIYKRYLAFGESISMTEITCEVALQFCCNQRKSKLFLTSLCNGYNSLFKE